MNTNKHKYNAECLVMNDELRNNSALGEGVREIQR